MSVYIARFTVDQLKSDKLDKSDKLQLNQLKTEIEGKLTSLNRIQNCGESALQSTTIYAVHPKLKQAAQ